MRLFRYADTQEFQRREFLRLAGMGIGVMATGGFRMLPAAEPAANAAKTTADTVIFVYIGGGQATCETWDPKKHTPFEKGMKAEDVHSTFPSIPTSADGIRLSQGMEQLASVMHKGTVVPSCKPGDLGIAFHVRHIFHLHTCYKPPQTVAVPSIGAIVARTLGPRNPDVPAYIDIGQRLDIPGSTAEIKASHAPGFLGSAYGPFAIPDPAQAVAAVRPPEGMSQRRFNERFHKYQRLMERRAREQDNGVKREEFLAAIDAAHRLMASPAAAALDLSREPRESYDVYNTGKFGLGCLLARRLVEAGARFIELSYEFVPFENWDTHEHGHDRVVKMKREMDAPLAQLIRDLDTRGLLSRTLIVVGSEFNRSMLIEGDGSDARNDQNAKLEKKLGPGFAVKVPTAIEDPKHYGMHRHYSNTNTAVLFGGGVKQGFRYGRTADTPPFPDVENPVEMQDLHATIYHTLGISPKLSYEIESRPVFVTPDGHGKPVTGLLAG